MVMCWVPGCKHYNNREMCRFFSFPKPGTKERSKWMKLIRREGEPGAGAYVCSCHFRSGLKENLPEIFDRNLGSHFGEHYLSPEKKPRIQKRKVEDLSLSRTPLCENVNEPVASTSQIQDEKAQSVASEVSGQSSYALIEAENYFLTKTVQDLKQFHETFSFSKICHDNKLVLLYTGLPDTKIFTSLYNLFDDIELNYYHSKVQKVPKLDQLLLTLMKLRLNPPHKDLAFRFNCAESVVSNIFITWIHALHEVIFKKLMAKIPSTKKNQTCLPSSFNTFSNCRIILDCTEVYTAVSRQSMSIQKATYSTYKQRNTWKGLVGVAPNGVITFVSKLYPGGTSDKKIVHHCGILDELEEGDLVLADKGFLIRDILPAGVSLNIPPFLTTSQFTEEQVRRTESIAKARVHVERAIRRMKCYNILNFIPESLVYEAEHVFQVVGALTNLQYPLIKEVEEYYN